MSFAKYFQTEKLLSASVKLCLTMGLFLLVAHAQQLSGGAIRGKVVDQAGALVNTASVTISNPNGGELTAQTNRDGEFVVNKLASGRYTVQVTARGFTPYQIVEVEVIAGKATTLEVTLTVTITEQVSVGGEPPVNTAPEANASAVVLNESDIKGLPDDPTELADALAALAGPGAGPGGGEIFIDGFSGGKLPPRDTIREIRINQNPISAEYDRLGFGRIEILTKPGSEKWNGEAASEFEDESLNSRNPFAANRPPFQLRNVNGNVGGPLVKKRASIFADFEIENIDNNALINALLLDANLNAAPFQRAALTPAKNFEFSPRFDLQINENNTLTGRYFFSRSSLQNAGLGGFDLLSRAYNTRDNEHTIRLTETATLSPASINEARFQYIRRRAVRESGNNSPTIRVLEAFTSGGANIGQAFANEDRFELQNYTSFILNKHILKVGLRARHISIADASPNNFAGTFTFTSLAQYRNTLLNLPGAFPTQFSLAGGKAQAAVKQTDLGFFAQDDWRVNPQLTLSFGLRYETQTNITSKFNFAPRFGFAYAPGAGGNNKPKTVFRGGFGIFYDRIGENLTLQAARFNGVNQQQFIVTDAAILDNVVFTQNGNIANIPTIQTLTAFAQAQTTRVVAPDAQTSYTLQTVFGVERQLPVKTTLSVSYVNANTYRLLRSRNINAPLNGARPVPQSGNIFQYEATGHFRQNQLIFNVRSNFSERVSLFGNFSIGQARSDTDGAGTFPANSYDLSNEYGRSPLDIRQRLFFGGSVTAPWGVRLSPFITFRAGVPFNVTTGTDTNGDTLFTERPAFATDLQRQCNFGTATNPQVRSCVAQTRFGNFDLQPLAGQRIVPRNYGAGPEFFVANLRIAKEFGFGGGAKKSPAAAGEKKDADEEDEAPFKLEFSVQIRNLFNHTNGGTPIGNLRSSFFGESVSTAGGSGFGGGNSSAGNRRLRFEVQFSF